MPSAANAVYIPTEHGTGSPEPDRERAVAGAFEAAEEVARDVTILLDGFSRLLARRYVDLFGNWRDSSFFVDPSSDKDLIEVYFSNVSHPSVQHYDQGAVTAHPWIGDVVDALIADVPGEAWEGVPSDLAESIDRKLYGKG